MSEGGSSGPQRGAPGRSVPQGAVVGTSRLYIVSGPLQAGDPLDVIAFALPALTDRYRDVRRVTPDGDISLRSLRRGMRPGRDRVLFDFTRPSTALWAAETARLSSGAVLCGARRLPLRVTMDKALRRTRRRYSGLMSDFFARDRLAALDVEIPAAGYRLERPAFTIPRAALPSADRYACAAICAADGGEESYGAVQGWLMARRSGVVLPDARLLLSVATTDDADMAARFCRLLGGGAADLMIDIERRSHRADLAAIAGRADCLIDLDRFAWTGKTEALAAAQAAGVPDVRITAFLSDIAVEFAAALAAPPVSRPVRPVSEAAFSASLIRFIEAAHHSEMAQNPRAGVAA